MGWLDGKKEKEVKEALGKMIPDALKAKTPEEIRKMLEDSEAAKTKAAELEASNTAIKADLARVSGEADQVKQRLQALEANRGTPPPQNTEAPEMANFIEEPDKAFAQRVGPIAMVALRNAAHTAKILATQSLDNDDMANKTMNGRLFRAWDTEIMVEANKYQLAQLGDLNNWVAIYYLIKGRHADELASPEKRKEKYNFLEPSTSSVSTTRDDGKPRPATEVLSAEELRVAEKMKIDPETYLKRKQAMKFSAA
jgi:hypothetical protein